MSLKAQLAQITDICIQHKLVIIRETNDEVILKCRDPEKARDAVIALSRAGGWYVCCRRGNKLDTNRYIQVKLNEVQVHA